MLILIEDPAETQSRSRRAHQRSQIRSHAARVRHQRRDPNLYRLELKQSQRQSQRTFEKSVARLPDPKARLVSQQSPNELRFLDFYRTRTACEWSGWNDRSFWEDHVLRIASEYPILNHSLTALAAYHEGIESNDRDLKAFSITEAGKAIAWVNQHHDAVPSTLLITHSIIVTQISGFVNVSSFLKSLRIQCSLVGFLDVDDFNLTPLSKRLLSRQCQVVSPLPLLRQAYIPSCPDVSIPVRFETIDQARQSLEDVLNTVASQVKSGHAADSCLLNKWQTSFHEIQSRCERSLWLTLNASYGMARIQIETMYNPNEMNYDNYLDVYADVAEAYDAMLASSRPGVQYRFNIDSGFMCLLGWAVQWCREPSLRTHLIYLLHRARRNEASQSSIAWARIVEIIKAIEEEGIHPPPACCADIPGENRIRAETIAFYYKARLVRIDYLRLPYSNSPPQSVWIPLIPAGDNSVTFEVETTMLTSQPKPDWIMGPGYSSFTLSDDYREYCTLRSPEFYFFIPKL